MSAPASRGAQLLRRATSRTRTARQPIGKPQVEAAFGFPQDHFIEFYAGPPAIAAENPQFPGHVVELPFADAALQLYARCNQRLAMALLLIDMGENRDLSRIEFYGNPLLPPDINEGRPRHNFGLPRAMGLAVREQGSSFTDLHRRSERGRFYGDLLADWNLRWMTQDLRGLWGWTPVHLGPTFGRHLLLAFADFPEMPGSMATLQRWGVDIQRIVIYPFAEGSDHQPHVECSPLAVRTGRWLAPSAYWNRTGLATVPDPALHPTQAYDDSADALCLPSALCGFGTLSPAVGSVDFYASDPISTDPAQGDRIHLLLEATCDETPLLHGVRLLLPSGFSLKSYRGPKDGGVADLVVSVHVTNDREAAWSTDAAHPGWRVVAEERRLYAWLTPVLPVEFESPTHARWVRVTVQLRAPTGVDLPTAQLLLRRIDLMRPRSWLLYAEPDEDLQVEHIAIRLRGEMLLDDYAAFDGRNSVGVTIEMRQEDGAWRPLRRFRTLLELMEETHHRVFANHRRADKPVQRYREHSTAQTTVGGSTEQASQGENTAVVLPEFGNRLVTRSGTLSDYVARPRNNLGNPRRFESLPASDASGLRTTRTYDVDFNSLAPPAIDLANTSVNQISAALLGWAQNLSAQGAPVSIGIGGNVGGNLGASLAVQFGGSVGVSLNVGSQIGGGVTHSKVTGNQGSVTRSETFTLESTSTQSTTGSLHTDTFSASSSEDRREVERTDLSVEQRLSGLEVRYGGRFEDIVIATVSVGMLLRGTPLETGHKPPRPLAPRDALRVRVDHLPPELSMDVEFRGRVVPHEREA